MMSFRPSERSERVEESMCWLLENRCLRPQPHERPGGDHAGGTTTSSTLSLESEADPDTAADPDTDPAADC